MPSVTVKVTMNRLPIVQRAFPRAVDRRLRQSAENVRDGAARRSRVDTGEMRDGWRVEGGDGAYLVVNDVEHTIFNEVGTVFTPAQPMLRPSMDEEKGKIASRFLGIESELV